MEPQRVTCPRCGSGPGIFCRKPSGGVITWHKARLEAAPVSKKVYLVITKYKSSGFTDTITEVKFATTDLSLAKEKAEYIALLLGNSFIQELDLEGVSP